MATTIVSVATRSSDLEDQMSGTNPQMEGLHGWAVPKLKGPQRDGRHWVVPLPTHHLCPQPGGHCPTFLTLDTALESMSH